MSLTPVNDNANLCETPEGAYFQVLKARRRHLARDTGAMSPELFRQWRQVLAGLDDAERVALAWLREGRLAPARRPDDDGVLARLRRLAARVAARLRPPVRGRR
jgi:hypothetical protein